MDLPYLHAPSRCPAKGLASGDGRGCTSSLASAGEIGRNGFAAGHCSLPGATGGSACSKRVNICPASPVLLLKGLPAQCMQLL